MCEKIKLHPEKEEADESGPQTVELKSVHWGWVCPDPKCRVANWTSSIMPTVTCECCKVEYTVSNILTEVPW